MNHSSLPAQPQQATAREVSNTRTHSHTHSLTHSLTRHQRPRDAQLVALRPARRVQGADEVDLRHQQRGEGGVCGEGKE
jgi:hypothetical protein